MPRSKGTKSGVSSKKSKQKQNSKRSKNKRQKKRSFEIIELNYNKYGITLKESLLTSLTLSWGQLKQIPLPCKNASTLRRHPFVASEIVVLGNT